MHARTHYIELTYRSTQHSKRCRMIGLGYSSLILTLVILCSYYLEQNFPVTSMAFTTLNSLNSSRRPLPFPFRAFWHLGDLGLSSFNIVAHEQYKRLQKSGLLQFTNVSACYLGPAASRMPAFNDSRIRMTFMGPANLYEFPTLRLLQSYCDLTPEARVLYFHTKGATKPVDDITFHRVTEWRYLMEHFMIDLHDTLLRNELSDESPYMTVGTQYWPHMPEGVHYPAPFHYSGNFWMAKCTFINTLAKIDTMDHANRLLAEFWLASGGEEFEGRHKDCWTMRTGECDPPGFDPYRCTLKRSAYGSYRACRQDDVKRNERQWR